MIARLLGATLISLPLALVIYLGVLMVGLFNTLFVFSTIALSALSMFVGGCLLFHD